jgi:nucleoside-diphosphate-sugar epimerase
MPDCIKAALDLMSIELSKLRHHNSFNIAAMSFSAGELAEAIRAHLPDFVCEFRPDHRQGIADSWPHSIDDSDARREWKWTPQFDLHAMTADMLEKLRARGVGD